MRKTRKMIALLALIAMVLSLSIVPVFATDTATGTGSAEGDVTLNGSVSALNISVTHPISIAWSVNPNTATVTFPNITITNNTAVTINVKLDDLYVDTAGVTDSGSREASVWTNMSAADAPKNIAVGIKRGAAAGWGGTWTGTFWADSPAVDVGTIAASEGASLTGEVQYALAFSSTTTFTHTLELIFTLA